MYICIYIHTSTHRGKRHKVAGTKRRWMIDFFFSSRPPHCPSSRLDRCEFKAFHAITHIGQFAYGICLSTHWTVNRMTYSAIRRHMIIHRGTCFFFFPYLLISSIEHRLYPSTPVSNRSFEIKQVKNYYVQMFFQISFGNLLFLIGNNYCKNRLCNSSPSDCDLLAKRTDREL